MGTRFLVELLITPVLVSGLGGHVYGAWRVLWQWTGYLWAASGRSSQALQSAIAHRQRSPDAEEKRQFVGSAVIVWLLFLPLLVGIGAAGVWYAPIFVASTAAEVDEVRLAAGILVADAILLSLLTIPRSVLQGENLGYTRIGRSAAVLVIGGGLSILAVKSGAGIQGVAAAALATTVMTGAVFMQVARQHVPWFGIARPRRTTLRWFLGLSSWFLVWKLVFELMTASDVLILAGLASLELVTVYVLTKFLADALSVLTVTLAQGITPGLGGIVGAGDSAKAVRIRAEMLTVTWLVTTVISATVVAWNASFVTLWVGEHRYAGSFASLLIVLMTVQFVFIRSDTFVIDVTLRLPQKVLMGGLSTMVSLCLAMIFVGRYDLGVPGLCAGIIAGRAVMSLGCPWLVGRALQHPLQRQVRAAARPAVVTMGLLGLMFQVGDRVLIESWPTLIAVIVSTMVAVTLVAAFAGLTPYQRMTLLRRAKALRRSV